MISKLIEECCEEINADGFYHIQITGDLEAEVNADRERVEQVIVNLVNNAIKYGRE
jgi:signal transduction histidine kinase